MGRPSTRKVNLKDGYYIEVSNRLGGPSIKLHRDTEADVMALMRQHNKSKNVKYIGRVEKGKVVKIKTEKAAKAAKKPKVAKKAKAEKEAKVEKKD